MVKEYASAEKVFDNLMIISNNSAPQEFEFEIIGQSYDWEQYKEALITINDNYDNYGGNSTLLDVFEEYLQTHLEIKKLPLLKELENQIR